ncbi:LOW QUALITY PROTEIN: 5-formyltetrahydrofolate cyclo-ligase [Bacillus sp. JCM 19046]|nr:LOW QUALITY PROTEIN: 5-formyltetrahydrofolate cyclo-ligase [Bacillus sp. JCM 19046]
MATKRDIRANILSSLRDMTRADYEKRSLQLTNALIQTDYWKKAKVIGLTVSRFPEVNTTDLINTSLRSQKLVALPRTNMSDKTMHFYYVTSFQQLEKDRLGLYEPLADKSRMVQPSELNLIVVPGVSFTYDGKRLGLGGGFYDRYLTKTNSLTVALCFSEQIVTDLPTEKHDKRMNHVLTEGAIQ